MRGAKVTKAQPFVTPPPPPPHPVSIAKPEKSCKNPNQESIQLYSQLCLHSGFGGILGFFLRRNVLNEISAVDCPLQGHDSQTEN